jgi:hypothetical protein
MATATDVGDDVNLGGCREVLWPVMPARIDVRFASAVVLALVSFVILLPGSAGASSASVGTIRDGYYSTLAGQPSALVAFHVSGAGGASPDLSLSCVPNATFAHLNASGGTVGIAIHAPKLKIHNGRISYNGRASVSADSAGAAKIGHTTLSITLSHVDGPVIHYTFEGTAHSMTTAWKGTASSPACAKVDDHGKVTLFGPVPGE